MRIDVVSQFTCDWGPCKETVTVAHVGDLPFKGWSIFGLMGMGGHACPKHIGMLGAWLEEEREYEGKRANREDELQLALEKQLDAEFPPLLPPWERS